MKSTWVSALLVAAISTGVVCQSDITVVSGVSGTVLPRREIRDLASDADQWNIFLLGLARLQSLPANDSMSYYQLAGRITQSIVTEGSFLTHARHTRRRMGSV